MGRYITTTGTASVTLREISTTYTAVANDRILATTAGGAFTITLPLSPLENDTIQVIDIGGVAGTFNITIARNGKKIQNLSEDLVININNASVTLVYSNTYGWVLVGT